MNIIIAGAGPVGLTAALLLATHGIPVTLLEKRPTLNTASRASTIHPPTLEILDRMAVLAPVAHQGYRVDTIQYRTPQGPYATLDLALLATETPFPYRLHLEQARITPLMLARLQSHPHATIRFATEALAVHQTETEVHVTIRHDNREETLIATHAIAADGAHSTIRKSLGIGFPGHDYPHKVLRVMTHDDLNAILPGIAPITYLHNTPHSASFLRMPDLWRIILRVPEHVPESQALDNDWILARFQEALPTAARLPTVAGKDVYAASRRVADRFHQGRVHLIGDAAHVTNTRGGMNMNAGIHDAAALADAFANGNPTAASQERHRIATELLIPRTDQTVASATFTDTIRALAANPDATRAYLRTSAMLDMLDRRHA